MKPYIIIVVLLAVLLLVQTPEAQAAITDNYNIHIVHKYNGTNAGVQTDYNYPFWIYNTSGTNTTDTVFLEGATLDRIFITDSDGANVTHHIELQNSSCIMGWYLVASTPADAQAQDYINIYLGDADGLSYSNGTGTFPWYTGFDDLSLFDTSSGTPTVSDGEVTVNNAYIKGKTAFGVNYSFRTRVKSNSYDASDVWAYTGFEVPPNAGSAYGVFSGTGGANAKWYAYKTSTATATMNGVAANAYVTMELKRNSTTSIFYTANDTNQVEISSEIATGDGVFVYYTTTPTIMADWALIRKYVYPEPMGGGWETPTPTPTPTPAPVVYTMKEHFNETNNWTLAAQTSIANSYLTANTANDAGRISYKALTRQLNVTDKYRFDTRITVPTNYDGTTSFYAGIGEDNTTLANWYVFGVDGIGIRVCIAGTFTTIIPAASVEAGHTYIAQIASDGTKITFSLTEEGATNSLIVTNTNVGTIKPTYLLANYYGGPVDYSSGGIDYIAFTNQLDGYGDTNYNNILRLLITTYAATDETAYIEMPATYINSTRARWVIANHGYEGTFAQYVNQTPSYVIREGLTAGGYVFGTSNAAGDNWGNTAGIKANLNLSTYIRNNFNVYYRPFLYGWSMGGIASMNYAMNNITMPAAMAFTAPVLQLDDNYYAQNGSANFASTINTAYSCDAGTYAAATADHNPYNHLDDLSFISVKIWQGTSDTAVNQNQSYWYNKTINEKYNGNITLSLVAGAEHNTATLFDGSSVKTYFDGFDPDVIHAANATPTPTPTPTPIPAPVITDFTGTPTSGNAPASVQFSSTTTGNVQTYSWSFGDGYGSSSSTPTHNYLYPGNYTVTLVVANSGGSDTLQKSGYVFVSANPIVGPVNTSDQITKFNDDSLWSMVTGLIPNNTDNYDLGTTIYQGTKPFYYNGVGNWWIVIAICVVAGLMILSQSGSPYLTIMAFIAGGDAIVWAVLPADWRVTIGVIVALDIAIIALTAIRPGRER